MTLKDPEEGRKYYRSFFPLQLMFARYQVSDVPTPVSASFLISLQKLLYCIQDVVIAHSLHPVRNKAIYAIRRHHTQDLISSEIVRLAVNRPSFPDFPDVLRCKDGVRCPRDNVPTRSPTWMSFRAPITPIQWASKLDLS
ncbi:hypothetical protein WA026_017794 [Henosepilachna vigintioctopunctata]|uniref:Uncharacterized protein n=1 Tax=Henosepilachna vigintioctopunctata TaxID=420089 RepID=A0AAW1UB05_9CUCU